MVNQYNDLVTTFKLILNNKKKFKTFFKFINNQQYDEINKLLLSYPIDIQEDILFQITEIISERKRISQSLGEKLNNLEWMNELLVKFNYESQLTVNQAKKILRTIYINIYDLEAGLFENVKTYKEFIKEIRNNPDKRYPLLLAKKNKILKQFLRKL